MKFAYVTVIKKRQRQARAARERLCIWAPIKLIQPKNCRDEMVEATLPTWIP